MANTKRPGAGDGRIETIRCLANYRVYPSERYSPIVFFAGQAGDGQPVYRPRQIPQAERTIRRAYRRDAALPRNDCGLQKPPTGELFWGYGSEGLWHL